jgi:hypothetical protein
MGQLYMFDSVEPMESKTLEIQSKQELIAEVMQWQNVIPQRVNSFV